MVNTITPEDADTRRKHLVALVVFADAEFLGENIQHAERDRYWIARVGADHNLALATAYAFAVRAADDVGGEIKDVVGVADEGKNARGHFIQSVLNELRFVLALPHRGNGVLRGEHRVTRHFTSVCSVAVELLDVINSGQRIRALEVDKVSRRTDAHDEIARDATPTEVVKLIGQGGEVVRRVRKKFGDDFLGVTGLGRNARAVPRMLQNRFGPTRNPCTLIAGVLHRPHDVLHGDWETLFDRTNIEREVAAVLVDDVTPALFIEGTVGHEMQARFVLRFLNVGNRGELALDVADQVALKIEQHGVRILTTTSLVVVKHFGGARNDESPVTNLVAISLVQRTRPERSRHSEKLLCF